MEVYSPPPMERRSEAKVISRDEQIVIRAAIVEPWGQKVEFGGKSTFIRFSLLKVVSVPHLRTPSEDSKQLLTIIFTQTSK